MKRLLGQRAVVAGPGIGGLSAAGVLSGYFEQIDVQGASDTQLDPLAAELQIRRLIHKDLPEIERHLFALGPADRHARFGMTLGDAAIAAYVQGIDLARAVLVGAVDKLSGRIVGLAEAQPAKAPGTVEMAVSVHASYRCRGLGKYLLTQALASAFERGAKRAEFLFAPENRPARGLVCALGARIAATFDRAEIALTHNPRGDTKQKCDQYGIIPKSHRT